MSRELWEGVGGPVRMDEANLNGIDPMLDACFPLFLAFVYRLNPTVSDRL
jgi:hypothetical protein